MNASNVSISLDLKEGWRATWFAYGEKGGLFELTFNGSPVKLIDAPERQITTEVELRLMTTRALESVIRAWREEK